MIRKYSQDANEKREALVNYFQIDIDDVEIKDDNIFYVSGKAFNEPPSSKRKMLVFSEEEVDIMISEAIDRVKNESAGKFYFFWKYVISYADDFYSNYNMSEVDLCVDWDCFFEFVKDEFKSYGYSLVDFVAGDDYIENIFWNVVKNNDIVLNKTLEFLSENGYEISVEDYTDDEEFWKTLKEKLKECDYYWSFIKKKVGLEEYSEEYRELLEKASRRAFDGEFSYNALEDDEEIHYSVTLLFNKGYLNKLFESGCLDFDCIKEFLIEYKYDIMKKDFMTNPIVCLVLYYLYNYFVENTDLYLESADYEYNGVKYLLLYAMR